MNALEPQAYRLCLPKRIVGMGSEAREGFVCSTIQDSRTFNFAANSAAVSISIWEKSCTSYSCPTLCIAVTQTNIQQECICRVDDPTHAVTKIPFVSSGIVSQEQQIRNEAWDRSE